MSKFSKLLFTIAVGALVCWWYQQQQPGAQSGAFIAFLDVGQGDAIYIRTSSGADVLIDGGPGRAVLERLPEVMAPGDTTIELMLLTHPDADHITGLVETAKRYTVKQIVTTALPATKPLHEELWQLIETQQIEHLVVAAGDHITLGPQDYVDILYPAADDPLATLETNDTSIIAEYHYQQAGDDLAVLLTGDAGAYVEEQLVSRQLLQDIDILKVGHHGSKTSSSQALLDAVQPELCVLSVGQDNQYGHPKPEILERLQPYCEIRRTDQEGNIIINLEIDE
ncbi:MAG: MBL fold metallo-hydrolase [Candidatus Kerfeldbacteria bacterium]|nr:MBL fold metallo-hydrolase [Candidatus Kerfeldbacteria bacterium]